MNFLTTKNTKVTHSGLKIFPVQDIQGLARVLRVEYMIYCNNQFFEIEKLLKLPPDSPLVKEARKLAERFFPKKNKDELFKRKMIKF